MTYASHLQQTATSPHEQELEQTTQQVLQFAIKQQQSGQIKSAENLYRAILEIQPNHPDANHNLGLLAVQAQQPTAGLPHFESAVQARPEQEQYWLSYIDALIQAGQTEIAWQVLELGWQHGLRGDAVENLAGRLRMHPKATQQLKATRSGKLTKKTSHKTIGREPSAKEINTVVALLQQGRTTEVETLARSISMRFPLHAFGWKVLGAVLLTQRRGEEALHCMQKAVRLKQGDAEALSNLGFALQSQGQLTEAEVCLRRALALKPNFAEVHANLGITLYSQGRLAEAEASMRRALALKPDFAEIHNSLGNILGNQGRLPEAIEAFQRALKTQPTYAAAHSNLLFCLSHDVGVDAQQLFTAHLAFGEQFEMPLRAGWQAHHNSKDPARCLQVGFVSGDLNDHAVASFLEPVLVFLAKNQALSLHAYYTNTREDTVTQRLRAYFPQWHAVAALNDAELADKIRADGIDILIDLSGHTAHNRLPTFACKPAPIQVSWLGYPGTTGLQAMDYYLCDRFWIPPGELDWQLTEKPAYLSVAVIFQPSEHAPPVNTLPALENGVITFGSFNRANKLNDSVIVLWSMLLSSVPNSRLLLGGIPLNTQDALIQLFAHEGIEQKRLIFYPRSTMPDYLALHHQVDICLDAFPYGGGTTTLHAAWMAVPTLTLAGETPPSRVGPTFMNQLGLDGFIATSIEDFVSKGCYWASHIAELATIRMEMRTRFESSALGQPQPFATSFEAILRIMWQRWCNDLPPVPIEVTASDKVPIT